jgi:uncharacterized protein (TIGR02284 family)
MGRTERDILNGLIEICRDGARGFQLAADHVSDPALKHLFADAACQRDLFAAELLPFAQRLGGESDTDGTARGKLHRGWMALKDAIMRSNDAQVLEEARRGEAAAVAVYAEAMTNLLPPNARPVVERQSEQVRGVLAELSEFALPSA